MRYSFTTTLFLSLLPGSLALPTGAGGCQGKRGAVGGLHLSADTVSATTLNFRLAYLVTMEPADGSGNVTILEQLPPEELGIIQNNDLVANTPYILSLKQDPAYEADSAQVIEDNLSQIGFSPINEFRGFLFRIENINDPSEDTTSFIEPIDTSYSSVAAQCTAINIGGVTHINNDLKQLAQALVMIPNNGLYRLDVTAVIKNRVEATEAQGQVRISQFAYTPYGLDIGGLVDNDYSVLDNETATVAPTIAATGDNEVTPTIAPATSPPTLASPTASQDVGASAPTTGGGSSSSSAALFYSLTIILGVWSMVSVS